MLFVVYEMKILGILQQFRTISYNVNSRAYQLSGILVDREYLIALHECKQLKMLFGNMVSMA